jgi:hypothetical protein
MPLDLQRLTANAEIVERLGWSCDLEFEADLPAPAWFSVDGAAGITPIASDGTGGVFAQLMGSPRVLYVSSEGAAGFVAADLEEFISLVAACPHWHDVLKFSANGNLDEMRRASAVPESGFDDEEQEATRALLKAELGLAEPADTVGALHRAVSTSDAIVRGPDGHPFVSLFNSLVIDEERMRKLYGG